MNAYASIHALDMVILYDSLHAGQRAKELCDRLAAQLETNCALRFHCWSFSVLSDAVAARVVSLQVMTAPCLIVAFNANDDLARPVTEFLRQSARVLHAAGTALVAQLHGIPGGKEEQLPALRCLQGIAATAGVPFFSEVVKPVAIEELVPNESARPQNERKNTMPKQKKQPKAVQLDPVEKPVAVQPTQAEIAKRAHEIYLARGGSHGCDLDDWLQAERELKARTNA
jgi:hypothetical protein